MYKILRLLTLLLLTLDGVSDDKWRVSLGSMFVTDFSTQLQISPKKIPTGIMLDTKDTLGMDYKTNVLRLDGYYRFTDTHSMDFSYFSVRSNGTIIGTLDDFDNKKIDGRINSYFNMDIIKVNYGYSFYHNDKVELMLTAGLHVTFIDIGLSAVGTITDNTTGTVDSFYNDGGSGDVTIPLPVVGFKGGYAIVKDKFFAVYRSEYFRLKFDGFEGSLVSSAISFEYKFYEKYGLGFGYNTNKINVEIEDKKSIIRVRNNLEGFMLNLNYTY